MTQSKNGAHRNPQKRTFLEAPQNQFLWKHFLNSKNYFQELKTN